jgi:hypothetical protein
MRKDPAPKNGPGIEGIAALAIGALAIGCCAGLPLIAGVASAAAIGTLLRVGGSVLAAAVVITAIVIAVRARKRRREISRPRAVRGNPSRR